MTKRLPKLIFAILFLAVAVHNIWDAQTYEYTYAILKGLSFYSGIFSAGVGAALLGSFFYSREG